ncbi:MAG: hypothetical protein ACD_7C00484G0002, partial [uncultured bacterium]
FNAKTTEHDKSNNMVNSSNKAGVSQ